ncbi:MAG: Tfp pilus assembly protein PilF [Limisphaerales bacterium]|jgi:Tfp pilus assembly protein PilF
MKPRQLISAILIGLFVVVLGVFWQTLAADFLQWDDDINVFENPHVYGVTGENLAWMFTDFEQAIRYKAFSWLAWAVVYDLFGLNPFGYHLANVFLHTMNAWLVFFVLVRMGGLLPGAADRSTNPVLVAAGLGALLWAVHPLRVEPVAWVTGLPYHLSLLFMLGSLLFYLKVDHSRSGFRQPVYWAAAFTYLLAVMTYPIVLGFGAVLVAMDLHPLRRFERDGQLRFFDAAARRVWIEKIPFLIIACLLVAGTLYGRFFNAGTWFKPADVESFTLGQRALQAFYVWGYYVWKPLLPLNLSPIYEIFLEIKMTDIRFIASAVGVVGTSVFLLLNVRRWPGLLALWIAHLGLLVPMLGLTERPHYPHDRYGIVNGVLWSFVAFAVLFKSAAGGRFKTTVVVCVLLAGVLGTLSFRQTEIWRNDVVFFENLAEKTRDPRLKAAALMKLGNAYAANNEFLFAEVNYVKARETDPQFPLVQLPYNYGNVLLQVGKIQQAIGQYQLALKIEPEHLGILNNLGIAHLQLQQPEQALPYLRQAVTLDPQNIDSIFNIATALLRVDRLGEAEQMFGVALRMRPDIPDLHRGLADLYLKQQKPELAQRHLNVAIQIEAQLQVMQ